MKQLLIFIFIGYSTGLMAFGQTGHRVTGEIAQHHLSEHSKQLISSIIGSESVAEASTYADEMRADQSEFWQKTARPYHYVTVPMGKSYAEVGAPDQGDAVIALKMFSQILTNSQSSIEEKKIALKFIIHIIGDLHQPLHAGNGTDRGGNNAKYRYFGKESSLHWVWDTAMIKRQELSYTEWSNWLNSAITKEDIKDWQTNDPLVWIAESVVIRDKIYPDGDSISYEYVHNNIPVIKQRLKQAGIRIAFYLDELFKNMTPIKTIK